MIPYSTHEMRAWAKAVLSKSAVVDRNSNQKLEFHVAHCSQAENSGISTLLISAAWTPTWYRARGYPFFTSPYYLAKIGGRVSRYNGVYDVYLCRAMVDGSLLAGYYDYYGKHCNIEVNGRNMTKSDDYEVVRPCRDIHCAAWSSHSCRASPGPGNFDLTPPSGTSVPGSREQRNQVLMANCRGFDTRQRLLRRYHQVRPRRVHEETHVRERRDSLL